MLALHVLANNGGVTFTRYYVAETLNNAVVKVHLGFGTKTTW